MQTLTSGSNVNEKTTGNVDIGTLDNSTFYTLPGKKYSKGGVYI